MNKESDFNYSNKFNFSQHEKNTSGTKSHLEQNYNAEIHKGRVNEKYHTGFYERRNFSHKNKTSFREYKYFYIFYNNNNYSLVKDFLLDKSLKILKPNHSIFYSRELEYCPNVYFMFINNDKKLVKSIVKKRFLKYDRETRKILENILLDTKTK
jgi:hypothetical protein